MARSTEASNTKLARDVNKLATKNDLCGCVLISLKGDQLALCFSGHNDRTARAMKKLAGKLLVVLHDDSHFEETMN